MAPLLTPEEEEQLRALIIQEVADNFDSLSDSEAQAVRDAIEQHAVAEDVAQNKKDVWNSSLDYALRNLREEMRQKQIKNEEIKLLRTAADREQQRIDALEKARRVGEWGGPKYDGDGNSNQHVPEAEPSDSEFLNAFERRR